MKRLLAMLLALIMSLTNNTSYSMVGNKEFPGVGVEAETDQVESNKNGDVEDEDDENETQTSTTTPGTVDPNNDEINQEDEYEERTAGYYTIDEGDGAPDYRDLMKQNPSNLETNTCKTTTYTLHPKHVPSSTGFWVIDGKTPTVDNLIVGTDTSLVKKQKDDGDDTTTERYMIGGFSKKNGEEVETVFTSTDNIVAPYDSTILTGGNLTLDTMELLCNKTAHGKDYYYKLVITGMRCWYCDYGRPDALDTSKPNALTTHTFKKMKGHKIAAGCVIGRATEDTCITIYKAKKDGTTEADDVSVTEFYNTK